MKRRAFMAGLSGAAAWPLVARAQVGKKRAFLGYLAGATQAEAAEFIKIFLDALQGQGYIESRDFDIAYRFADRRYDRLQPLAKELVALKPDVIITPSGDVAVLAIKAATQNIPIVSPTLSDPVRAGLINSFNQPGGNVTGVSTIVEHLSQKQLAVAAEALPGRSRFAVLINVTAGEATLLQKREIEEASSELGLTVVPASVQAPDDLDAAFQKLANQRAEAVIVLNEGMFVVQRQRIVDLATANRLPDVYPVRDAVVAGGLLSYGVSLHETFRKGAALVINILEGASPANMPVEFPSKLELVINLKTAKSLDLTIPPTVLARADEVIE
jgi:putative ABC transport system substrate-binding protein